MTDNSSDNSILFDSGLLFDIIGLLTLIFSIVGFVSELNWLLSLIMLCTGLLFMSVGIILAFRYIDPTHETTPARAYKNIYNEEPARNREDYLWHDRIAANEQKLNQSTPSITEVPISAKKVSFIPAESTTDYIKEGEYFVWAENSRICFYPTIHEAEAGIVLVVAGKSPIESALLFSIPISSIEHLERQSLYSDDYITMGYVQKDNAQICKLVFKDYGTMVYKMAFSAQSYEVLKALIPDVSTKKTKKKIGEPDAPAHVDSIADEIRKLAKLTADGIITEEEFFQRKEKLLDD